MCALQAIHAALVHAVSYHSSPLAFASPEEVEKPLANSGLSFPSAAYPDLPEQFGDQTLARLPHSAAPAAADPLQTLSLQASPPASSSVLPELPSPQASAGGILSEPAALCAFSQALEEAASQYRLCPHTQCNTSFFLGQSWVGECLHRGWIGNLVEGISSAETLHQYTVSTHYRLHVKCPPSARIAV